jgi:hypothetical protein
LFLHIASGAWNETIQRAKACPEEILCVDDNGNTPLHRACQLDPPVEVVMVLSDAVTQTNHLGATPLHIAASHRCNARTLRQLMELYPGALCQRSQVGRTPIHYACMSYRGLDLVAFQVLLEKTLEESRRRQQEHQRERQQQQQSNAENGNEAESDESTTQFKITDFIDIVREAKEGDSMENDEDISLLLGEDTDSQFAMGVSGHSASSWMQMRSTDNSTMAGDTMAQDNEEDEEVDDDKNINFNVVTWKDNTGNTPLGLLFRRYRERVRSVITLLEQMRNGTSSTPVTTSPTSLQTDLGHLWGKARLIVARLTEEHQQQEHEQNVADTARLQQQHPHDDASSVGQQHWTAAASWSKERFTGGLRPNNNVAVSHTHARASAVAAAVVKEDLDADYSSSHEEDSDSTEAEIKKFRQFRIVHASVALTGYGCPPEMIRLAISIHPHQVREMDEDGNLPLHIAAAASSFGTLTENMGMTDEESSVISDGMASLFSSNSARRNKNGNSNFDTVIKLLLKQYPQAAQTPHGRSGRLPLVLAARAGHRSWGDGMKTLLRAYPPALFSGSRGMIPVKLYPYALALIGGGSPLPAPKLLSAAMPWVSTSSLNASTHSYGSTRVKGRGGMAFLHQLLLSKQRQIRELTASSPASVGRHRDHLHEYTVPLAPGSGHSKRISRRRKSTSKKTKHTKIDPKLATTMFELLRTKPDLVEVGRSYHEKMKRERLAAAASGECKPTAAASPSFHGQQSGTKVRGKRTMSRKLLERMTVFERKSCK